VSNDRPGFELPLLLLLGFRSLIDDLHVELARQGHPDVRPVHGFVLQAIGPDGTTAVELGRRLGISKQAAGKTIATLERLDYVQRAPAPDDGRQKVVELTDRGTDCLVRSARIFDQLREGWVAKLGAGRVDALEDDLRAVVPGDMSRLLTVPGWFSQE
jgi:DNA-binding MarR family transcriptional regulator